MALASMIVCLLAVEEASGLFDPQTAATHHHAQLGLPDKSRTIKGLVVCWMLLNLGVIVSHPITIG